MSVFTKNDRKVQELEVYSHENTRENALSLQGAWQAVGFILCVRWHSGKAAHGWWQT